MSEVIHPLPQYAFMVWCSVKAQGQLYIPLVSSMVQVFVRHQKSAMAAVSFKHRDNMRGASITLRVKFISVHDYLSRYAENKKAEIGMKFYVVYF
jgi:hypothetical protein